MFVEARLLEAVTRGVAEDALQEETAADCLTSQYVDYVVDAQVEYAVTEEIDAA